jgi:hypothetical protein
MPKAVVDCSGQTKAGSVVLVHTLTLNADVVVTRARSAAARAKQESTFPAIANKWVL